MDVEYGAWSEEHSESTGLTEGEPAGTHMVYHAGVQYGPATMDEIRVWRDKGLITSAALVWRAALGRWESLDAVDMPTDVGEQSEDGTGSRQSLPIQARDPLPDQPCDVHGRAVARASNRRRFARLPLSIPIDYSVMTRHPIPTLSLPETIRTENISSGGLALRIFNNEFSSGMKLLMKIHLGDGATVDALGEVVRVQKRTTIGVGFKELRGRDRLLRYLIENRTRVANVVATWKAEREMSRA